MVVELFGPPGAGKTTFARALADRLRDCGRSVDLRLSVRPSEEKGHTRALARLQPKRNVLARIRRPLGEMAAIVSHPRANWNDLRMATRLVKVSRANGLLATARQWQYVVRLFYFWRQRTGASDIVVFDQGFVQAACSLLVSSQTTDDKLIISILEHAPKADLAVRMESDRGIIEARLLERLAHQSKSERALERDIVTCLAWSDLSERLHTILVETGRTIAVACSFDENSLNESTRRIEHVLATLDRSGR